MDIEWWKSFFEIGGVVLLFLTFAFGAGFMLTGKVVNERQAIRLRQFEADNLKLRSDLNGQVGQVAGLQVDASNAKAAQQQVQLDLEKQREITAKAEEKLLLLAKRQHNRYVPDHSIAKALKGKPTGTVTIWYQPNDPEAYWFAFYIMAELLGSHWKVSPPAPVPEDISSVSFLGPEFQQGRQQIDRFDRAQPPVVRISGGNAELTLLSNSPDKGDPSSTVTVLTNALKPLVQSNWGWRLATTLPSDNFILVVGPKP